MAAAALGMLAPPAVAQEGWTLRALPDAGAVAVAPGPGPVAEVVAFCLSDAPWLALRMRDRPETEVARVVFGFSTGALDAQARREASAGDAYVIELAGSPLAASLAGRDATVDITVGGEAAGALSLRGSSRAVRAALAPCLDF